MLRNRYLQITHAVVAFGDRERDGCIGAYLPQQFVIRKVFVSTFAKVLLKDNDHSATFGEAKNELLLLAAGVEAVTASCRARAQA
eukprot:COSAG05_NODE_142_length_16591_cov_6.726837_13_plen_85_part_00